MRKIWKFAVVFTLMMTLAASAFAAGSKTGRRSSGGDSDSDSGSSYSSTNAISHTVNITDGVWELDDAGNWHLKGTGGQYISGQWAYTRNPYANNAPQWFYFDDSANMLTGWVWIKGKDGLSRCYYLNPASDGTKGKAQLGGTTPDGWQVNSDGAWIVEGVVQTR